MKKLSKKIVFVALLLVGGTAVGYALSGDKEVKKEEVKEEVKPEAKQTSYRWFKINNTHVAGSAVPSSDAVYLNTGAEPDLNEADKCSGSENQCISGFNPSQTTASGSGYVLNGNSQMPNSSAPNILRD